MNQVLAVRLPISERRKYYSESFWHINELLDAQTRHLHDDLKWLSPEEVEAQKRQVRRDMFRALRLCNARAWCNFGRGWGLHTWQKIIMPNREDAAEFNRLLFGVEALEKEGEG